MVFVGHGEAPGRASGVLRALTGGGGAEGGPSKSGEGGGRGMGRPRGVMSAWGATGAQVQLYSSEWGLARGEAGVGTVVGRP